MDPKQHPSVAASDTASAEPRLSALLKPAQASALTSTLVVLEKTLGEIERLCDARGNDPEVIPGALQRVIGLRSDEARAEVRDLTRTARTEIGAVARKFELKGREENAPAAISALASMSWMDLEECRPARLKGWGAVDPLLAEALTPHIDRLISLLRLIASRATR